MSGKLPLSTNRTNVGARFTLARAFLAMAPVFLTFLVQLMIWPIIRPFAWFLFTPAVFLGAWIGGRRLGILASVIAALLVWYFFRPVQLSFVVERPAGAVVVTLVFVGMGAVFSLFHDRLKRAERRVAEAHAASRYQAAFENAAVGIARVAPDGRFLEVNQRLCDIVSCTRQELLRKTFRGITHPDDLEADSEQAHQLWEGEIDTYSMEKRYCRKDGSIVWIQMTVSLVRQEDGSPDYFISVIEDISGRKQAEEKLRDREERLRLALRAAGLGVFEWNVQADRAVWENDRMYEIFGHTRADGTLSKERLTADYVYPDDVAILEHALADGMKYRRPVHTVYRICRKDGGMRWLDLSSNFELAPEGQPIRMIGVLADITDQRVAEGKLRASEEQFRILADTAPVLIWISGTDKLCTFFNKPWLDFTGRTMEQELGNGWTEGVHPEDYDRCLGTYVTAFEAHEPFTMEYRLRRDDGEYRWIVDNGVPRFAPNGDFLGYIGSCIDITERKEIERALRASELRFRTMISAIPSLTYEGDANGNNTFVSDQWCAYTGMTAKEAAGKGFRTAFHPDDAEDAKIRYQAAMTSGTPFESRLRIQAADGCYRWFLNRALPGRDSEGRIVRWAGSLTDIEDLVRIEQELRESKERLAGIVSTAMDAIITVDEEQRVVLFNEAAEKMFGCPAAEAMGQALNRFIPELFRGDHSNSFTALRADGTQFPIEAAISSIEVGGRKLFTIIHRDITERKQAEAERQQLAQEQAARAAAEAANRAKDEFLALVSHELRSPLTAILGYTRMLRSGPADRETIDKATAVVERSAKAQLRIIEDLLDSARIITGKLRIELEPVDLVPVLEAALDTARLAAEAKGVKLAANFGPMPEQTLGDSTRLQQVVWNLLTNAIKFTPEGGRVELRMEGAADYIRITVSDNGKGIEPAFLPFVFDRFRQADSSSARRVGGLGLGLSLVKHLVELHGGTIMAASEGLGRGSTFTVTLPHQRLTFIAPTTPAVTLREVRTKDTLALDHALSLEGVSVLVVDDQEEARVVLTQALSEYRAHVTALSSGGEALAFLADPPGGRRPDVLILDIAMPGEDGYTVLKRVRALETEQKIEANQIPAIALTAFGRSEDRLHALQAGFHTHVAKPVEPAELAIIIASLTNRRVWPRRKEFHREEKPESPIRL